MAEFTEKEESRQKLSEELCSQVAAESLSAFDAKSGKKSVVVLNEGQTAHRIFGTAIPTNYAYLEDSRDRWVDINKGVVDNIRHKWYKHASQGLVADVSEGATHISQTREEALRAELAGRTGETDGESEQA
ncbi:hypothetical protein B0H14DRAFT_2560711 [Mycena olivaceomarginata]|nr:hypothetical protein B0H14DRAFT_2560711 [Mycena olivaceomarginata]